MNYRSIQGNIVLPDEVIKGEVHFDTHILEIRECTVPQNAPYIFPAFIDIHTHGCDGYDVMNGDQESIFGIAREKAAQGVSHFLPTTLTAPQGALTRSLIAIAQAKTQQEQNLSFQYSQADILGIHLEGPYISKSKYKGSQNPEFIRDFDFNEFELFWNASDKNIKIITLAPEKPNAIDFIKKVKEKNIRISAGHTEANEQQCNEAVEAGLSSGTHLFNGMKEFNHYDLGVVGSVLLNDNLYCEIIGDGHHISFTALPMVFHCKPVNRIMCITDSTFCSGLPDGDYVSGGLDIVVKNGMARTKHEGGLAGSLVKMDQVLRNIITRFSNLESPHHTLTISDIAKMMAQNQAEFLNIDNIGKIEKGYQANFAIFDQQFNLMHTIKRGTEIYGR